MGLRFILGRSGSGKTTMMLNEIRSSLREQPEGTPIIYLVPDQMTFSSEYKLVTTPDLSGMIRTQVFSFSRLAWRILQETGGMTRIHLDSVGINMLIRKIMEEKKNELKLFQRSAEKFGFISQMEEMLTEFKRYCIEPETIKSYLEQASTKSDAKSLHDKLHDLELIYQSFETELFGKYIDSEDYLRFLAEKISAAPSLHAADIYVDGFFSLTPQEIMVLEQLMKVAKSVTIGLTLDRPFRQEPPEDLYLFRMSGNLYHQLYSLALANNVPVEQDVMLHENMRHLENESLLQLEEKFNIRPAISFKGDTAATFVQAVNRRAEVEEIARTINKHVRQDGYRWKDIGILLRNGSAYHDLITTIFHDYKIPMFIDTKNAMLHHPLLELIRSALETLQTNWRYEPVFRAIKTELLFPVDVSKNIMRSKVDKLENYVLSRGIKGNRWTSEEAWRYRRIRGLELEERGQTNQEKELEQELNELRALFTEHIIRLGKRLKKAHDGRTMAEALFLFLEEAKVPEKLEFMRMEAEEAGKLVVAREHEQAWKGIMDLLDQFVELMGDENVSMKQFINILESGLESLKFSLVPPAIDQVLVANLDTSRLNDVKIAFVIGLNDGVLPSKVNEEGIFNDRDRDTLLASGLTVAPSSKIRLLDEEFAAYRAFTTGSDRLYLTYPLADEEGKSILASSYIKRVKEVLPEAKSIFVQNELNDKSEQDQLFYMVNEEVAIAYLTSQLGQKKKGYPVDAVWWDLYNYYMESNEYRDMAKKVLSSLFYENRTKRLKPETTKKLYGEDILASVSRMEKFNSCAFSHFASHGLKLQERKIYRLDAPDIGDMFHGALKIIADSLMDRNVSWASLNREQCADLAKMAIERLAPKLQNQILLSSNRHHYVKRKLENVIGRASYALSEHARKSGFSPVGLELGFGRNEKLPPLTFQLANGTKMELMGRIDRVDKAESANGTYLRVLDYKSSQKALNLNEVYYGLALQMLTYLDIIVSYAPTLIGKKADPAGVLYFHVHNPMVKGSKMLTLDEIEAELMKSYKMKGLLLADQEVLELMDDSLEAGTSSKSTIIPAAFTKTGGIAKTSKVASLDDFNALKQHVRGIYQQAGTEIVNGKIDIDPYKLKDRTPCTFCSFKSVCQFDPTLDENDYRNLKVKKDDELLEALRKEGVIL
ncbi:helicase-exonuclease AddAB subunit AddB [Peribacillus acanthi]|uniref:helicase-exonuclease AddAB subunit AddB n=1 Tax=Peribacillus acanthi TaxID=2171554 RepID=UPI000D3E48D9|nr:helicase-exonuclease AddAB subunit AddB [Peribacillus acanthi]